MIDKTTKQCDHLKIKKVPVIGADKEGYVYLCREIGCGQYVRPNDIDYKADIINAPDEACIFQDWLKDKGYLIYE